MLTYLKFPEQFCCWHFNVSLCHNHKNITRRFWYLLPGV